MDLLTWLREETQLKKMVLITVFNAFFLDHMLLSVVVPILPSILYTQEQVTILPGNSTDSTGRAPLINTSGVASSTFAPALHRPLHSDHHFTPTQKSSGSNCSEAGLQPDAVNIKVGLLLASKSTVQLIFNPFTGPLTDRVGYHILICAGFCIIFLSATLFAFSSTYILLLLARSLQGVGGSCLSVAGMSMLADVFTDDEQRGRAMRVSFTGLALALIVGAPFGSVMYQFVGKMAPFLVLAVLTGLCGGLHFYIFQPRLVQTETKKGTSLLTLLQDPYILISAGAVCWTTLITATLEATLPIWMMKTMCATKWLLGVVFLPDSVSYLIAANVFGYLSQKYSVSWLSACAGMILAGITAICFGFSTNIYHVMALNAFIGLSLGIVDTAIMPLMGFLVDLRYVPVYGTVYAIADFAVSVGFCVGPAIAGPLMASIGFTRLMAIIGTINIIFGPLCIFLFRPPRREEPLSPSEGNRCLTRE